MDGSTVEPAEARAVEDGATSGGPGLTFEGFFHDEHARLYRAICLVTGSSTEADEIVADAFVAIWKRWERVRDMQSPGGYLNEVAMNLMRRRWRRTAIVQQIPWVSGARDEFASAEARSTVQLGLAQLSPRQRAALVLTDLLGFDS